MPMSISEEWIYISDIYSAFLENPKEKLDKIKKTKKETYAYCEMKFSNKDEIKTLWVVNRGEKNHDHVIKQIVDALTESMPSQTTVLLSSNPCINCKEYLLDYISSNGCKIEIWMPSIHNYNCSSEARSLKLLNDESNISIEIFGPEQWQKLCSLLNKNYNDISKTRNHWDNEWKTVLEDILNNKIVSEPKTGLRLYYYKPRSFELY